MTSDQSATSLHRLLHQFAALQPLHQLVLPPSSVLARSQPWLVDNLLNHPRLVRFPPAREYKRGFLKILIARLEEGCADAEQAEELVRSSLSSRLLGG